MNTIFLKKMMPFAIVMVTGTAGAFLTTSMQKTAGSAAPEIGYVTDDNNIPCNKEVDCSTDFNLQLCRVSYAPPGQQAKGKDNNCDETLYRPSN
ncbi:MULTISPECIES: hypothetical protein [Flavobacterium]|uniref:NVEALA protein n=2 Tax=Flavobacterium TaxID=237 RepID=A0A344LUZ0_9FLAO|nr:MULTISPECIES: hypothetical protein [Flavobacterium]AXB57732.1 hypothetical protein HYN86_14455 [Flavobacterium fluviale]MXO04377.1 hypothetical protein [Flavobacterium sp. HBTb2-11-1]